MKPVSIAASADGGTVDRPMVMEIVPPAPIERARVLLVDDDERNLLALATALGDCADVVTARSGEEALRHLLRGDFAVILLDVYMPGMDGYETAQMIRNREQTKRIPIIFLSAVNKETSHLLRGYAMGAVDYVFKPVDPVILSSKVAVFVDLFAMRREVQRKAEQEQQLLDAALKAHEERLRAERELRLAEQRQAAIIASLPIILYLETAEAGPRLPHFVSANFPSLTGYTLGDVKASASLWCDRLHPDDRERVSAIFAARGDSFAVEYRWQCADGRYRHFLDQAVLLRDADGRPLEYAGTLLDITDRRELEDQLHHVQKMDAIGKLTGGIAHDFNNLLASVLGGLGMIERRIALEPEQARILDMTRHAAEQGAELVARLMAFARKQKLEPARVEIAELSHSISALLQPTLGGLVDLAWDLADKVWPLYADAAQLELALMNLIINSRDAMPTGGTITVSARNARSGAGGRHGLPPGDFVVIAVADTGSGIPRELMGRVLEPFFTTKPVGKGTGLGLSMVYGFAQQSGGTLRLESAMDKGTIAELWMPRAPQTAVADKPPVPLVQTTPARALRALLVDDHAAVRETTAALLTDLGHEVACAEGGRDALELLAKAELDFDLLITDFAMPHMSGAELIETVRKSAGDLPCIMVTGNAEASSHADGNYLILPKPFSPSQLEQAIAQATAASRP